MKYSLYLVFLIVSLSYNAKQMYGVHLNNRLTEVQSCTSSNSLSSILYLILYLMKLRRCNVCYTCCMMLCKVPTYGYSSALLDRTRYPTDNRVFKLV